MERNVVSGVVKKLEIFPDEGINFITLTPTANECWSEMKVPVYMDLKDNFEGEVIDIITERRGLLGRDFKQVVQRAEGSHSIEMPYSVVRMINNTYRYNKLIQSE